MTKILTFNKEIRLATLVKCKKIHYQCDYI